MLEARAGAIRCGPSLQFRATNPVFHSLTYYYWRPMFCVVDRAETVLRSENARTRVTAAQLGDVPPEGSSDGPTRVTPGRLGRRGSVFEKGVQGLEPLHSLASAASAASLASAHHREWTTQLCPPLPCSVCLRWCSAAFGWMSRPCAAKRVELDLTAPLCPFATHVGEPFQNQVAERKVHISSPLLPGQCLCILQRPRP